MKKVHRIAATPKTNMRMSLISLMLLIAFTYIAGCSSSPTPKKEKIRVPPVVNLKEFGVIGVIAFASNEEGNAPQYVTQQFMQTVQSAQPGVRLLELGPEAQILKSVGHTQLTFEAIRSIGVKYKVDALFYGNFVVSDIRPEVDFSSAFSTMHAQAYVEGKLNNKLFETASGATIWTHLASGRQPVAKLSLIKNGPINVGVTDPQEKYGQLVDGLVAYNTKDFWPSHVYRTASK
jgi:hypothetical protein